MSIAYVMPSPANNDTKESPWFGQVKPAAVRPLKTVPTVRAIANVQSLKGCTRPLLMQADDGHLYAVKFSTNPLGTRILVNEYFATRLAKQLQLATPEIGLVGVRPGLGQPVGLHFGSRLERNRRGICAHEWLPAPVWGSVRNPQDLIGAFVFDAWTGNIDERQVIFVRNAGPQPFKLLMLDHGHCFGGPVWRLLGLPIVYPRRLKFAYASVTSWHDLDPWLSRIEQFDSAQIELAAAGLPSAWLLGEERLAFERLKCELADRRLKIRAEIARLLAGGGHPFSCWRYRSSLCLVPPRPALGETA